MPKNSEIIALKGLFKILVYSISSAVTPVRFEPSPLNPTEELTCASNTNCDVPCSHSKDLSAPSIVIPAPSAAEESTAPLAINKFLSSI